MKIKYLYAVLLSALSAGVAQASEFDGGFVGVRAGSNHSDISGLAPASGKSTTTYGLNGGYNWDMQRFLLGVDAFVDSNNSTDHTTTTAPFVANYGSNAYGVDAKLGFPSGRLMPYVRLGYSQTNGNGGASAISGGDLHGGVGGEYKFSANWSLGAEWTRSAAKSNSSKLTNDNYTFALRYYFGASEPVEAKAAPEPAPAPKMAPAPAPLQAPAPAAEERWKTILTEKPVRLEGANFATGSAKLLKTADAKLMEVVNAAKQYPQVGLEVSGHTDSTGKKALNQKLSENRAASVKTWLVKHGVAADRITTAGYADTKPIADNKTKAGRAANRRVEVQYVIKEEKKVRVE